LAQVDSVADQLLFKYLEGFTHAALGSVVAALRDACYQDVDLALLGNTPED
jgi:hypothetical protein